MDEGHEVLTGQEAQRLWQRAAQLQAEAARRAEALASADPEDGPTAVARRDEDGYQLEHVRAAALEVGISGEYVDAALAELRVARAMDSPAPLGRARFAAWILAHPPDAVEARRVVRAGPGAILAAMEEVLPAQPYELLLRERIGDPARGGTLVFDIQGVGFTVQGAGFKGDASFADLRQVYATIVPLPGEPPRTELVLRSPVVWARALNASLVGGLSVVGGTFGFGAGLALAAALAPLGPVAAGIAVASGLVGGARLTLGACRKLHHYGLGKGAKTLEAAAATVAARAEGGWGFLPRG